MTRKRLLLEFLETEKKTSFMIALSHLRRNSVNALGPLTKGTDCGGEVGDS